MLTIAFNKLYLQTTWFILKTSPSIFKIFHLFGMKLWNVTRLPEF